MANQWENRLQEQIVAWCRRRGLRPIHVANEHTRGPAHAAIAKRRGLEPGVADLLILEPSPWRPEVRGVALELKAGNNKATRAQLYWLERQRALGWVCAVVRTKAQAVEILTGLGYDGLSGDIPERLVQGCIGRRVGVKEVDEGSH